jgi:hypothetical protein
MMKLRAMNITSTSLLTVAAAVAISGAAATASPLLGTPDAWHGAGADFNQDESPAGPNWLSHTDVPDLPPTDSGGDDDDGREPSSLLNKPFGESGNSTPAATGHDLAGLLADANANAGVHVDELPDLASSPQAMPSVGPRLSFGSPSNDGLDGGVGAGVTAIPAPGALGLFGLAAAAGVRRRRR